MFKEFFGGNRNKYVTVKQREKQTGKEDPERTTRREAESDIEPTIEEVKKQTPREEIEKQGDHLWTKCRSCQEIIFNKKLNENQMICPVCDYHFRISAKDRIKHLLDEGSFVELFSEVTSANPLEFEGYGDKMEETRKKTGLDEAVITGRGKIHNLPIGIGIMDFSFAGGSMGSAVGEKLTSLIEFALSKHLPLVIFSTAGGARMQEGMLSLMQMAKTSAALAKYSEASLPYISIMTDPTTGGVTASYAMLGDINIAEPGALIAFAGPRVIKQTISQDLPEGFQRAEFLLEHGMIDRVVHRHHLKDELYRILNIHRGVGEVS